MYIASKVPTGPAPAITIDFSIILQDTGIENSDATGQKIGSRMTKVWCVNLRIGNKRRVPENGEGSNAGFNDGGGGPALYPAGG